MRASFKLIKLMERGPIVIRPDRRTQVIGLMICSMARALKLCRMGLLIKVTSELDKSQDKESMLGLMAHTTRVIGKTTKSKGMGDMSGQMGGNLKELGRKINFMAKGSTLGQTVVATMVSM